MVILTADTIVECLCDLGIGRLDSLGWTEIESYEAGACTCSYGHY